MIHIIKCSSKCDKFVVVVVVVAVVIGVVVVVVVVFNKQNQIKKQNTVLA